MRMLCVIVIAGMLSTCPSSSAKHPLPVDAVLSTSGIGPIKIGMNPKQLERAARWPLEYDTEAMKSGICTEAYFKDSNMGVTFMFIKGVLVRIEVNAWVFKSKEGFGQGSTFEELIKYYGNTLKCTSNGVVSEYQDCAIYSHKGKRALVYVVDDENVVSVFRAGKCPEVFYDEDCL